VCRYLAAGFKSLVLLKQKYWLCRNREFLFVQCVRFLDNFVWLVL